MGSWNLVWANVLWRYYRNPNFSHLRWRMTETLWGLLDVQKNPLELPGLVTKISISRQKTLAIKCLRNRVWLAFLVSKERLPPQFILEPHCPSNSPELHKSAQVGDVRIGKLQPKRTQDIKGLSLLLCRTKKNHHLRLLLNFTESILPSNWWVLPTIFPF